MVILPLPSPAPPQAPGSTEVPPVPPRAPAGARPRSRPARWGPGFLARLRGIPAFLPALALSSALTAAEVTATLSPESVPAGEGATLTIRIVNGTPTALNAPQVPNLIMKGPNQGRQVNRVNGVTTSSTTLSYLVGSMTAGAYHIPPFTLTVDGAQVETQALKLTVTPSASQAPAGLSPGSSTGQPPAPPASAAGEKNPGFLTVDFAGKDRQHAWVGEIAPVRIRAWLPAESRVSLTAPLQPKGSAFTLHNLSAQPQQDTEIHDGKRYLVVTWYGGLSATKAGTSPPDLSMKISMQVPDPSGQRQRTGDPFIDQFPGRNMIQQEVELHSRTGPDANLEIRPLPKEGRPDDFDGAVGKFTFGRTKIPSQWKTGEPQQITAEIEGEGNFNLLKQPTLQSGSAWKSYDGQSTFAAKDAASFTGLTTFRFSQVPRQSGLQQVRLTFSYFDPDLGLYQTPGTPPQAIEVTGTDLPPETAAPATATIPPATPAPPSPAPQRARDAPPASLTPFALAPGFRFLLGLASAMLLSGPVCRGIRAWLHHPQRLARAAHEKALRLALGEADSYAVRGDVSGFFAAARRALQVRLATLWQRPAQAITLADLTTRMPEGSPVIQFFREADHHEFSRPGPAARQNLPNWRALLNKAMTSLPSAGS